MGPHIEEEVRDPSQEAAEIDLPWRASFQEVDGEAEYDGIHCQEEQVAVPNSVTYVPTSHHAVQ